MTLERALFEAYQREANDDHLNEAERLALVEWYKQEHPNDPLPLDVNEAFVEIVS